MSEQSLVERLRTELADVKLSAQLRLDRLVEANDQLEEERAKSASLRTALAAAEAERDEWKTMFDECAIARDAAGFIGTVPECIAYYEGETVDLRAKLAAAEARIAAERRQALEDARAAYEAHDRVGRDWVEGSLWDTLNREAVARVAALLDKAQEGQP